MNNCSVAKGWFRKEAVVNTSKKRFNHILISFIIIIAFLNRPVFAEPLNIDSLLANVQKAYDETEDFIAAFTQNATIKSINKTVTEEGTLYLKKPGRMFWDYKKPALKKLVLNPQKAWLYMPVENAVYVQDSKALLSSKMTIRFLTGIGNLKEDFDATFSTRDSADEKGNYLISLIPKSYESGIKELLLSIDRDNYYIAGCKFIDMYENTTELTFRDIKINNDIPDKTFIFTPPKNVEVYNIP